MARKKSNRWIRIELNGTVLYFKNLQEVADYFNLPSKQYVSDIMHGRRKSDYLTGATIEYVNLDSVPEDNDKRKVSSKWVFEKQKQFNYHERAPYTSDSRFFEKTYSKDYWTGRMMRAQRYTDLNIEELEKQYAKIYQNAHFEVQKQFQLSVYRKSYPENSPKGKFTRTDLYNMERYKVAEAQLELIVNKMGDELREKTKEFLQKEYETTSKAFNSSSVMFHTIDERKLDTIINEVWCADGKNWSERIWTSEIRLKRKLQEVLMESVLKGYSASKASKILQEEFGVSRSNANRLARTELAHIETVAAQDRYKEYGITKWQVLVSEDEKTCPICKEKAGKKYSIDEAPVPLHPRCRCAMIPVVEF